MGLASFEYYDSPMSLYVHKLKLKLTIRIMILSKYREKNNTLHVFYDFYLHKTLLNKTLGLIHLQKIYRIGINLGTRRPILTIDLLLLIVLDKF